MASSSIGPGFLIQTTVFTQQLLASFGFVILVAIILDLGAQLNTWRILTVSELRAQDLANHLLPGLGFLLSALVIVGGFAFNIGNIAGCGLGMNVLSGISYENGAIISCVVALLLFWASEIGKMLDGFAKILGTIKILLAIIIAIIVHPPVVEAMKETIMPVHFSMLAIVTIVGGTVGGYITFSGAHRLLDAGINGRDQMKLVNKSAVSGIIISTIMRFVLFLAVLGVVSKGIVLDNDNPLATVFKFASGEFGYRIFGIILWSAAISSVVGASYTSVSFFKTFHPVFKKYERICISVFIILSTLIFVWIGKPKFLLIIAGQINGFILPFALSVILIGARKTSIMKGYRHPLWMQLFGWSVVILMGWMSMQAMIGK